VSAARRWQRRVALALLALAAAGAAGAQPTSGVAPITRVLDTPDRPPADGGDFDAPTAGQRADPWEPFNRAIFHFNQDLDRDLLLPWTDAYVTLVPPLARTGVGNFFANAQDLWSAANNLFQGKFEQTVVMTMRFATNTVFGVFGLIDIATAVGMERYPEDFGQTLGVWGFPAGPYMVLPLFGPSTVRDTIGLPLDLAASPYYSLGDTAFRPATTLLGILNTRSQLLSATEALDTMALDKYSFVRDVFLKRRLNLIFDGEAPDDLEIDGTRRPTGPAAPPK
jgi:phospholipid-binding lipoprotein MlaA